jgi:transmembrane sensor
MSHSPDDLDELLLNDGFCRWIKDPAHDPDGSWATWLAQAPEPHVALVRQARLVVGSLPPDEVLSDAEAGALWQGVLTRRDQGNSANEKASGRSRLWPGWYRVAAGLVLATGLGLAGWYYQITRPTELQTAYGDIRTVSLPDGSVVTLNSHSWLTYRTGWSGEREVWLTGEAFFRVNKQSTHQRPSTFTVHTDGLDVQVLGTRFNVLNRRSAVRVLLTEGKVELRKTGNNPGSLVLRPGDLAELAALEAPLSRRSVDSTKYLLWMDHMLLFEQATLLEVAQALDDHYGLEVRFADPALASLTFTGNLPTDNAPLVLRTLQKAFGLTITRRDNQILIQK